MQARHDRQRSICLTTSAVGRRVLLQHLLDQVDAPARADRARRRAAHRSGRWRCRSRNARRRAGSFPTRRCRVGELGEREVGLHGYSPRPHAAGIENALGIEAFLHALAQGARAPAPRGCEHIDRGAHRGRCADQRRMAAERGDRAADRGGTGLVCSGIATQIRPPAQS